MKVFISWSGAGSPSHQVALILHGWLPSVIQAVKPFVSSEDIDKGTRGLAIIENELQDSSCGIICITRANYERPWLNFEAGALSKQVDQASTRVMPLLIDIKTADLQSPLTQLQTTELADRDDVYKMIATINRVTPEAGRLSEAIMQNVFNKFWPDLKDQVDALPEPDDQDQLPVRSPDSKLDEILELLRYQSQHESRQQAMFDAYLGRGPSPVPTPIAELARRPLSAGDTYTTASGRTILITADLYKAIATLRRATQLVEQSLEAGAVTGGEGTASAGG